MEKVKHILSIALLLFGLSSQSSNEANYLQWRVQDNGKLISDGGDRFIRLYENLINMPVMESLTEFSAVKNENRVQIKWSISGINENSSFIIEKSKDGKKFKKLTDIMYDNGTGDYAEFFETDYHPAAFYRIKQKDQKQEYKYSQVVFVKLEEAHVAPCDEELNHGKTQIESCDKPVLVVVRGKSGNEYASKVMISVIDGKIIATDESQTIPAGEYFVIASKVESIDKQNITIK